MSSAGRSRSADFRAIKEKANQETRIKIEKERELEQLKNENLRQEIEEERIKHQKEVEKKLLERENNKRILDSLAEIDMETAPTAQDYLFLKAEFEKLKLLIPQSGNAGGSSSTLTRSEIVIRNFNKDPIGIHHAANPAKTILACDGFNFQIWEKELNRTLRQVFQVKDFSSLESNFAARLLDEQDSISRLIRSTINEDLLGIVDSTDKEDPWLILELLKAKCSRSDRRHKISLVEQIIALATDKTPGSEVTLAKWSRVMAEVKQYKVTVDELGGLFLQSSFVAPIGVDPKTFEFSVDQNLELKDKPSFSDVTTVIQAASSKSKNKTPVVSDGYAPMDLDAVHAMRNNKPLYTTPHRRPHPPARQDHQNYQKPGLSVERANRFRGKPLNEILKARYGDACHYCKQTGHWYNNCAAFWDDVDQKVIDSPPRDFDNPQSNYLPCQLATMAETTCHSKMK
ncbi:Dcp1p-Dcp2p decapping enzyme complex alpha subunit [Puccinia graminis f. sp. tritici]|uniref:Dcp1p-Dcp2p decapping enzyme complex alpha subunit n=1 Tax=Puccinia graminis f. sp. tritici TaxID=56615 RepID=A0A5B0MMR9_PUCGR|nr:Dcp1p-Dcp2p decapping enzyme complex alpha subunit [Puccinia graminis f. sp. tritici]